jgi:antitoxin component YwqK of YwqJK toxin-antitoxin module
MEPSDLPKDDRYRSSIPAGAIERIVSEYRREGNLVWPRRAECCLDGEIVGKRFYDEDGTLTGETPLKDGQKHGVAYRWDDGQLISAEPYWEGKPHGTGMQWDEDGRLLGTYTLVHGMGLDIWRAVREDGSIYVSEVHSMRDGVPHGFEWWLDEDQASVWDEKHWHLGELHGIERRWNDSGRLRRGWPQYWIHGTKVTKRQYLRAAAKDDTLPPFREEDQLPQRSFPPEIRHVLIPL